MLGRGEARRILKRHVNHAPSGEARLKRLAAQIDALAEKDEKLLQHARKMAELRKSAAAGLHRVCGDFVQSLNGLLARAEVALSPSEYSGEAFQENGSNLFQIAVRGRILQIEFTATPALTSTEDFRIPYTLEGSIRAFNQDLLDRSLIEEQLIFFTLEKHGGAWRFFDARTYRSGPLDQEYLVSLLEQLL